MAKVTVPLLFLCLRILFVSTKIEVGYCPNLTGKQSFDMEKFVGHWYYVARYVDGFQNYKDGCSQSVIKAKYGGLEITDMFYDHKRNKTEALLGKAVPADDRREGTFRVVTIDLENIDYIVEYIVLDTDYENYAVVYMCVNRHLIKRDASFILSRNPTLDTNYFLKINYTLASRGLKPYEAFTPVKEYCSRVLCWESACLMVDH